MGKTAFSTYIRGFYVLVISQITDWDVKYIEVFFTDTVPLNEKYPTATAPVNKTTSLSPPTELYVSQWLWELFKEQLEQQFKAEIMKHSKVVLRFKKNCFWISIPTCSRKFFTKQINTLTLPRRGGESAIAPKRIHISIWNFLTFLIYQKPKFWRGKKSDFFTPLPLRGGYCLWPLNIQTKNAV